MGMNNPSHERTIRGRNRMMRFWLHCSALLPVLLLASSGLGYSQTQERKLMDRMLKPDMELQNPLQTKSFGKASSVTLRKASESVDSYAGVRDAYIKEFPYTRSFLGIKNPWFGGKVYDSKGASLLTKSAIVNADREVPVKKAEAANYSDATKGAYFGSPVVPVQPFIPQPAAQGSVSGISGKINEKMTIDEVRELLNKPH